MKTKLSILSALLILIFTSSAFAYDLTGMWEITYYYRNNPIVTKALIKQTGDQFTFEILLKGTVSGNSYTIPGPIMAPRRELGPYWFGIDGFDWKASDENNIKGTQTVSIYASKKAKDRMRQLTVKMIGTRIADPDPRIMPQGGLNIYIKTGTAFTEPGIFAHNGAGENITDKVVATGTVDANTPGAYKITYNVTDDKGKKAPEVVRTVNVVNPAPPTLKLNGDENATVQKGTLYSDSGATASNYLKEDITDKIKISVNGKEADPNNPAVVVTSKPEVTYTITYQVADENGKAEAVRNVVVKGSEDEKSFWEYCFISTLLHTP